MSHSSLNRYSMAGVILFGVTMSLVSLAGAWGMIAPIWTGVVAAIALLALPPLTILVTRFASRSGQQESVERIRQICEQDVDCWLMPDADDQIGLLSAGDEAVALVGQKLKSLAASYDENQQARQAAELRFRRIAGERDQLNDVFKGLSDPIVAVDGYGQIVQTNNAFLELFDLTTDQAVDKQLSEVIDCPPLLEALETLRKRRSSSNRSTEISIPDGDGKSRWYRAICRPNSGTPGSDDLVSQGAVAVLTEITSLKLIQQRNAEFVAAVSHEMKTPLSSIKAYVELLADGEAEDEATREEFLGVINGQAERLQRLIDNLLNLARIEAGVVSVNKESQALNQILQEAVEVLRPAAEMKRITLSSELSSLYLNVLADRDTLLQAAINLLSNAIKYTAEGGSVTIRSKSLEENIIFEVQDTGVGLNEVDAQKVFEKFYRVKKDKHMAAGTGLGLPLVKHIVEDIHGGAVEVHSVLGKGSTFSVRLPQIRPLHA